MIEVVIGGTDEGIGGRYAPGKSAEVLAGHHRWQADHLAAVAASCQFVDDGGHGRVVVNGIVACFVVELVAGAAGFAQAPEQALDGIACPFALCWRRGAHAAGQAGRVGNDVLRGAGMEHGVGDDDPIMGREATGHHALQQRHELRGDHHRVDAEIGHGGVAALALDDEVVGVGVGGGRAGLDVDGAGGQRGDQMLAVDEVEIVEMTGGHHLAGAAGQDFFGVLEDGVDLATELVYVVVDVLAGGHQDRGVAVVAAGVHLAGHARTKGQLVAFLLYRQGVDVGAQADLRARSAGGKDHHHAGRRQPLDAGMTQPAHLVDDVLAGLEFLEGQFGMLVQVAAPGDGLVDIGLHDRCAADGR